MIQLFNFTIGLSISIIILGAILLFRNFPLSKDTYINKKIKVTWFDWVFILGLIFVGSVTYTVAAYLHLKLDKWTFLKAFLIAIPFLCIEYQFSLRGNQYAKIHLNMNVVQITILTMIFYFLNAWFLNIFVLKHPTIWWREILAFFFIIMAFLTTTSQQ